MATSGKDIQQDLGNKINNVRENDNAVYVIRVVIMAAYALLALFVVYLGYNLIVFKSLALQVMSFKEYFWFGLLALSIIFAFIAFQSLGRYIWSASEALSKSNSQTESVTMASEPRL